MDIKKIDAILVGLRLLLAEPKEEEYVKIAQARLNKLQEQTKLSSS